MSNSHNWFAGGAVTHDRADFDETRHAGTSAGAARKSACATIWLLVAFTAHAQQLDQLLRRLDQSAASFTGARADVKVATYTASIHQTDTDSGSILVREISPGKIEFRIDIAGDNAYALLVRGSEIEYYHPQNNTIDVYELGKYRNTAQTLMALGFGTSGRDLKANYSIANLRRETVDGQQSISMDLTPKSADLMEKTHLQKVEVSLAESNLLPVREKFSFKGGDTRTADYSHVQTRLKIPSSALDLPKNAKKTKH